MAFKRILNIAMAILTILVGGVIVLIIAAVVGLHMFLGPEPDPANWIGSVTVSPDKRHKAVLFKTAQSGMANYCYEQLFLVPEAVADDAANRDRGNEVYSASCDDPIIQWIGNDSLQITYSKSTTDVKSKPSNAARTVKVNAVPQKQ